jgi:hypothetical protein
VFSPFKADTDYFAADHQWMLNVRVDDLDGLLATLRAAGIKVITNRSGTCRAWGASRVSMIRRAIRSSCGSPISPLDGLTQSQPSQQSPGAGETTLLTLCVI